jgi:metallophosphoesterase (TIGR00282 family)
LLLDLVWVNAWKKEETSMPGRSGLTSEKTMKIAFLGDIVGRPGRNFVMEQLRPLRRDHGLDFIVANGENAAGGSGINTRIATSLRNSGVDGITLGDHVWDEKGFTREIGKLNWLCRPANLPSVNPGKTSLLIEMNGLKLGVVTVLGRQFMKTHADCPFHTARKYVEDLKAQGAQAVILEIHAETTSEKIAMGWYMDGLCSLVVGTHTHVPTADHQVLPRGTAYITDVGMCGPYKSVLGRDIEPVLGRFLDGVPRRFSVATEDVAIRGCIIETDDSSGLAISIVPLHIQQPAETPAQDTESEEE